MKKKIILVLVALITVSFIAVGCGEDKETANKDEGNKVTKVEGNSKTEAKNNTKTVEDNSVKVAENDTSEGSKLDNTKPKESSLPTNKVDSYNTVSNEKEIKSEEASGVNSRNSESPNLNNDKSSQSSKEYKKVETPAVEEEPTGDYVYVNGGKSKSNKYHKSPTVHKMEGAIKMTREEAESQGYVACKRCYYYIVKSKSFRSESLWVNIK